MGDVTSPFIIPGGVLILRINEIKEELKEIDFDLELSNAIEFEKNKQLNQYSKIYFDKTRKNFYFDD